MSITSRVFSIATLGAFPPANAFKFLIIMPKIHLTAYAYKVEMHSPKIPSATIQMQGRAFNLPFTEESSGELRVSFMRTQFSS